MVKFKRRYLSVLSAALSLANAHKLNDRLSHVEGIQIINDSPFVTSSTSVSRYPSRRLRDRPESRSFYIFCFPPLRVPQVPRSHVAQTENTLLREREKGSRLNIA